ncbi:MAG: hypothetical protein ACREXP_09585 [Steroidobacteraceae bacterium]
MKTNTGRKSLALLAVACGMAGCSESEAPATPPEAPSAAAGAITPGIYDVCEVSATEHGDVKGDHLDGNKVEIRPINAKEATAVCIGPEGCPDDLADPNFDGTVLWMIGDEKLLRTVQPFEHHPADDSPGKSSIAHLVQILQDPTDQVPDTCKKGNVLILRICHPAELPRPDAQWECAPSPAPHGADAHIEN